MRDTSREELADITATAKGDAYNKAIHDLSYIRDNGKGEKVLHDRALKTALALAKV